MIFPKIENIEHLSNHNAQNGCKDIKGGIK